VGGYGFVLTPEVLGLHRGVAAHYQSPAGVVDRQEPTLDLDWPSGLPLPAPFDASFTATLTVPAFGQYQLALDGPPSLTLTLDGVDVLTGGKAGVLPLARGNHVLRLIGTGLGAEPVRLRWAAQPAALQPIESRFLNVAPVQTTGLLARLYDGEAPSGEPRIQQVDPNVNLQVHLLPLPRPYTIEWSGSIRVEKDGFYRFGVGDVGVFALWIDDVLLGETVGNGFAGGDVDLAPGWHDIKIRFIDRGSFASVTAYWQVPGRSREIIPTSVLRPWPSTRVAAARPEDGDLPAAGGQTAGDSTPRLTPTAATARPVRAAELPEAGEVQGVGALSRPRGIAAGPDGAVYVVESGQKAILRIAPDGSTSRIGEGALTDPSAVAVLPDGGVVVLDAGAGTLMRFDGQNDAGTRLFAGEGFYGPRGLTATADGRLIVSDTGKNRLMIGSPNGSSASVTEIAQPTGAAVLRDGTILAAETGAERIVQVNADGVRVASWTMPTSSTSPGPHAVALPDGGWAVTAPEAQAIIMRRGEDGPVEIRPLGDAARRPSGLLLDQAGRLVVADAETGRLRIFTLP
jgi:streptogramin lyase